MSFLQLPHFRKAPVQNSILLLVIGLHLVFLLVLFISPTFAFKKKQHKPLIVKTILTQPPSKTAPIEKKSSSLSGSSSKTAPVTKQQMAKVQTPPKKEQAAKNFSQKSTPPSVKKEPAIADKQLSKQPPAKKNPPPQNRAKISDSLLKELDEGIAKIENKSNQAPANKKNSFPNKAIAPIPLQIDIPSNERLSFEEGQSDYADILVNHLHQYLSLPDYGEVKIQLSLRQDGTVAKVVVLKTQSEKNKQHLENTLPLLKFPRFEGGYANKKEYAFILTFCNE